MDMEARLRRLEDRAALDDLVVRYFLAADGDDMSGVAACFTPDATFASSGTVNAGSRAAIVDFIAASRSHMGLTVHTPHYGLFTFQDAGRATGLVGAHLELALAGEPIFGAVRYQDSYRLTDEGWRISARDMRVIYMAPWLQVGEALLSDAPVRWPGAAPAPSDYPR